MPNWQIVTDAYARLLPVRSNFDSALAEVIEGKNAGALPVLELLAAEVESLTQALLEAFGPVRPVVPD